MLTFYFKCRCKRLRYPANLPAASIIIIFRDELLSVLLRTVYSILENTPENLVLEIILVDDGSVIGTFPSFLFLTAYQIWK